MTDSRHLSKSAHWWFVATLLAGTFTMSISQSSLSTAYPTLMHYFSVPATTIQWLTTGFMLVMTVMIPVSPWLLANVAFKKLFLSLLATFDVGTMIIIMAPTFGLMLFGRILEAIAVGVLFPAYQTVLLQITPSKRRGSVMGTAGLVMGSALAVGPIISGIVLHFFTWQAVFICFALIITVVFCLSLITITSPLALHPTKLDFISAFSTVNFLGFLYVLTKWGQNKHWTVSLSAILILSILGLILFVWRQLTSLHPMLELRVLKKVNFDWAVLLTGISYIALIVVTIIFPLYYQNVLHLTAFISGMALVPGAVILSLLNPLTGKLADRLGFKVTLLLGMTMITGGWLLLFVLQQRLNLGWLMVLAAVIEGGNAFVMMPAVTLGADVLPKKYIAHGTAVITTARQILGSFGVTLATILLSLPANGATLALRQQQQFHLVFGVFFGISLLGLCIAFFIQNQHDR